MWILLEIVVFYSYITSAVAFVIFRQIRSTLVPKERSDIRALLIDFISYAEINLTWFNFNFVLVTGPLIVLWVIEPTLGKSTEDTAYVVRSDNLDYYLIWILFACHLYQFTTKVEIYFVNETKSSIAKHETFKVDNDDDYQDARGQTLSSESEGEPEDEGYYQHITRRFRKDGYKRLLIFIGIYTTIFLVAFTHNSSSVTLSLYIALDFSLSISMSCFYLYHRSLDMKEREKKKAL